MRIGSLFTGYGGLDMAVEEHFDARTAWCSDIDPGACKIIAHRMPSIPNLGDITAVDWASVEPVDILCGGWPCQPFSLAGKRKGAADERALWPFVAGAVRALRPRHVVLENVAAIASAGELARATADLSALGYDTQWRCLRAADVGAPHGRARIFITASDTDSGRGAEPGGDWGRLSDVSGVTDVRNQDAAADASGVDAPWPIRGRDRSWRPVRADRNGSRGLAADADGSASGERWQSAPRQAAGGRTWSDPGRRGGVLAADAAGDGRQQRWPEPARLIGGSDAAQRSDAATDTDGDRVRQQSVTIARSSGAPIAWGPYESAIRRWERILGREAPAPTETSPKGSQRLSPRFVEWMMGLPADWVCDVPGLTRNEQLKALGNGVVPQQALAALRIMASLEVAA